LRVGKKADRKKGKEGKRGRRKWGCVATHHDAWFRLIAGKTLENRSDFGYCVYYAVETLIRKSRRIRTRPASDTYVFDN